MNERDLVIMILMRLTALAGLGLFLSMRFGWEVGLSVMLFAWIVMPRHQAR